MYQAASQGVSIDPIIARLRPRTVGEILDQAFRLYRKYFGVFLAIIAVVHVPLQLAQQIISAFLIGGMQDSQTRFINDFSSSSDPAVFNQYFTYAGVLAGATVIISLVGGLLQSLAQGALTGEVANSHLDKPVSFRDAYSQMFSRLGPLLGVIFLQLGIGILIFVPVVLLFVVTFAGAIASDVNFSGSNSNAGTGIVASLCFSCLLIIPTLVLFLFVFVKLSVITPAVMVERIGPVQALRRSWDLVKNYWWRTFGLFLILGILGYIVQVGPAALVQGIAAAFAPRNLVVQQVISGVVTVFTTLIYIPIQLTAVTLYYFDLRVRKEGYDIEAAVAQRYAIPPPPPPAWAGAGAGAGTGYGQSYQPQPIMPPPPLGEDSSYGYGQYGQYGQGGAPTQSTSGPETGPLEG